MSSDQISDSTGQRDYTAEANIIKQDLTKPTLSKVDISFTSLAESAIPNLSCQKILAQRLTVTFVPDFFYIMERCQILFSYAKNDKTLAKIENLNVYSFTLYMAYSLMYAYLANTYENDSSIPQVYDIIRLLQSAGFGTNRLPSIVSHWLDGIGKYICPETKRHFVPYVPTVHTQGDYFDNYFLSNDTAHLLPNFRGLFALITAYADQNALNMNRVHMTTNVRLGSDLTSIYPALIGTTESRRNYAHIPGMKRLTITKPDDQLPQLLVQALNVTVYPSEYHRYMMLDTSVLRYLKEAVSPLFNHIETITYSNPNPIGTSFVTMALISEPDLTVIRPQTQAAGIPAANNIPIIPLAIIEEEYERCTRVKSRTEIRNGFIDYAYQTPIVRIINKDERIVLGNFVYVEPQHPWYLLEHEFQTPKISYTETLSLFYKK